MQDFKQLNLGAGPGVAVREFMIASGPADYVFFVDRMAVSIVEAKKTGTTLSGVFKQSVRGIDTILLLAVLSREGIRKK